MNDTDKYILDVIEKSVWSGFYDTADVHLVIDDSLEDDADEPMLRAAVAQQFAKKAAAEKSWPAETDCDRLDRVFEALNASGIIALQNAGNTMSEGIDDVGEELDRCGREGVRGYCFYHGQDLDCAVSGGGLMLAFGDLDDDKAAKTEIGRLVETAVESEGFRTDWNGDPETRINIPDIDGKRRSAG